MARTSATLLASLTTQKRTPPPQADPNLRFKISNRKPRISKLKSQISNPVAPSLRSSTAPSLITHNSSLSIPAPCIPHQSHPIIRRPHPVRRHIEIRQHLLKNRLHHRRRHRPAVVAETLDRLAHLTNTTTCGSDAGAAAINEPR